MKIPAYFHENAKEKGTSLCSVLIYEERIVFYEKNKNYLYDWTSI